MVRVLAAMVFIAAPVAAQGVRGTVSDQASRQPIPGAVVFLLDASNGVVGRDLTSESGGYRLSAPRPGTYRLRTMRIGFRPVVSNPVTLGDGSDVTLDLSIESIPVSLSAVKVERQANCPARQDVSQAYNAWNEVSTALQAALLSSRVRGTTATIVAYDRWTAAGTEVVLRQGANVRSGIPGQPWRSVGADSLHRAGFVVKEANGWSTFHAVDLDVLLSDYFLQDHCLQLRSVDRGEIAIEFTPARDRSRVAEIRGFVWLDAATLHLKRLQFRYVNVEREYEQADAGGDLEFLKLSNGSWVVSRWQIRMPTSFKQARSDSYGGLSARPEIRATEVKTTGGDLLRILQNGDTLWALPPISFEGKVLDSTTNAPIPGARVVVSGTTYSTVTNEFGRFRIDSVLAGAYMVHVYTPMLDSLATHHQTYVVFASQVPGVDIRVPNRERLIERWCPAINRGTREISGLMGMLVGIVRSQRDSAPVPDTEIAVEWMDVVPDVSGNTVVKPRYLMDTTDAQGTYRICGMPWDHRLKVSTALDGGLAPLETRIGDGRVRRQDFWMHNGQRLAAGTPSTPTAAAPPAGRPAQQLQPVEVSAERTVLRDFEERRAFGIGHFITRAELEKSENRQTGDVLSKVPGARVARALSGGTAWIVTGRTPVSSSMVSGDSFDVLKGARPACYADVWVDNSQVYTYRRGDPLFDVNTIQPNQIEGIEVYTSAATIPTRYARGGAVQCGLVIIWTRR